MSENRYIPYNNMRTDVISGVSRMSEICRRLNMNGQADTLDNYNVRMKNHTFSVGIMGEFKRGKSTVINALLGQKIVPADIQPCSATLNYIRWDSEKRAEIHFKDGTTTSVDVEDLSKYVTKLSKESEELAETVDDAVVYYPCSFCQNGVQIVDTPGLNDDEKMNAVSEQVVPNLDAIIMVISADAPFSMSEAEFVRTKVMTSDLGRIIFIVNKIDQVDEEDRDRLLRHIKGKIQESVLEKTAAVFGEDSDEYKATKAKIGEIRLLGVSARDALKGKTKGKTELLEESGYSAFEDMLSILLTEERGALELIPPVNQVLSAGKEALQTIDTRLSALSMSAEEFEQVQKDSIAHIEETRAKKKEEISGLKSKSKTLYADLLPEVQAAYADVASQVESYINNYPISSSDFADDASAQAFAEKVSKEISKQTEASLAISTERLQYKIQEQLGNDVKELEAFAKTLTTNMDEIRLNLKSQGNSQNASGIGTTVADIMIDTAVVFGSSLLTDMALPGVGGLISGFREHGVKGAVVGGLSGVVLSVAAATALVSVGIGGLPALLVIGAASSLGGKTITNLFFGKKKRQPEPRRAEINIDAIRSQLLDSARNAVNEMRQDGMLEKWLKDNCEGLYASVAENIDQEWENTLRTMEDTLTQIRIDLEMNAEARKNTEKEMAAYVSDIQKVMDSIQPIAQKLTA